MKTKTDIVSLDSQISNLYKVTLSGREFTAAGVTDDHVYANVPSPEVETVLTYNISVASSVDEGLDLPVTITTENVANGTTLHWTVTNAGNGDFVAETGSFTINNDTGNFTVTPLLDFTTEGPEVFYISIRTNSVIGPVVTFSPDITINDTSTTPPPPVPSYQITSSKTNVNEGENLLINVTTENVADGTTLYWVAPMGDDFIVSAGSVNINNNLGSFSITPVADNLTEGVERFSVILRLDNSYTGLTVAITLPITINDTSLDNPEPEQPEQPDQPDQPDQPGPEPEPESPVELPTTCSRFILNQYFDLYQDIYVSFETTSQIDINNGLVVFISNPAIVDDVSSITTFLPGNGLGILYPVSQPLLSTGHLISVALDGIGNYGLSNVYAGGGAGDVTINTPHSITTRVARNTTPFEHLNTSSTIDELKSTTPNTYRFRFKGFLNKVYVDILQDGEYYNIYNVDTNVNINDISRTGQLGFSYSGEDQFGIKNVTYSAVGTDTIL